MEVEKRHVQCPHCKYEWDTKSQGFYATCPRCRYNVHIEKHITPFQGLEHFNLGEHGVKILDRSLATKYSPNGLIVDVYFKDGKAHCEHDESDNCKHVEYALSLPVIQAIFKNKGWKTP